LDDVSIYNAYKKYFEDLTAKGFKPKLNVMDNQATGHIKKYLTENDCKLQIVEPHNHCVNAVEWAIQTFKGVFIASLATTDSDSPLQLLDRLTPQVEDTLNMLRASCVDPIQIGVQDPQWTIQLEPLSPCPTWVQSCCLQGRQHTRIMGIPRH
jgi:hypothetical protein